MYYVLCIVKYHHYHYHYHHYYYYYYYDLLWLVIHTSISITSIIIIIIIISIVITFLVFITIYCLSLSLSLSFSLLLLLLRLWGAASAEARARAQQAPAEGLYIYIYIIIIINNNNNCCHFAEGLGVVELRVHLDGAGHQIQIRSNTCVTHFDICTTVLQSYNLAHALLCLTCKYELSYNFVNQVILALSTEASKPPPREARTAGGGSSVASGITAISGPYNSVISYKTEALIRLFGQKGAYSSANHISPARGLRDHGLEGRGVAEDLLEITTLTIMRNIGYYGDNRKIL